MHNKIEKVRRVGGQARMTSFFVLRRGIKAIMTDHDGGEGGEGKNWRFLHDLIYERPLTPLSNNIVNLTSLKSILNTLF